jgi:hypothetical protein
VGGTSRDWRNVANSALSVWVILMLLASCRTFPMQDTAADLREWPESSEVVRVRRLPDGDVPELARFPALRQVNLHSGWAATPLRMGPRGFRNLAALPLPHLEELTVSHAPNLEDASLRELARLQALRRIVIEECTGFSERGLAALAMLPLQSLELTNCRQIDDSWIPTLGRFRTLEYLGVSGTDISAAGYEELRARVPGCRIDRTRASWRR